MIVAADEIDVGAAFIALAIFWSFVIDTWATARPASTLSARVRMNSAV